MTAKSHDAPFPTAIRLTPSYPRRSGAYYTSISSRPMRGPQAETHNYSKGGGLDIGWKSNLRHLLAPTVFHYLS
ncbi:hypothetical protein TNCT_641181 [Trichonephila clavata]|uniref:Uncharacterized protein n=1 Tax=Trichonephila clavata TaxID=2740835 RepID=A0A8X6KN43_TRICU|nr:hypothetical protein TNCT_641181 [Trichonephila clavata]